MDLSALFSSFFGGKQNSNLSSWSTPQQAQPKNTPTPNPQNVSSLFQSLLDFVNPSQNINALKSAAQAVPGLVNQYVTQPLSHAIDSTGQGFFQNTAKDAVNVGSGILSTPGVVAQFDRNPIGTTSQLAQGILHNYQQDFGMDDAGNVSVQNIGQNLYKRPISTLLDILPIAGAVGKAAGFGKAGEVGTLADATEAPRAVIKPSQLPTTSELSGQARLNNLIHSGTELLNRGYTPSQVRGLSAEQAYNLLQKDVAPFEYEQNPQLAGISQGGAFPNALRTDDGAVQRAAAMTEAADTGSRIPGLDKWRQWTNPVASLPKEVANKFADWVNGRAASKIEGMAKAQEFTAKDEAGLQGILDFQKNSDTYPQLREYFGKKYTELRNSGIDLNWKSDYLPQIWKDADQANQVLGRRLSQNAPFTLRSVLDNYQEGLDKGLVPQYNKLSDLVHWYDTKANKLLADNDFFQYLTQNSLIQPASKAPHDWVQLGEGFPAQSTQLSDGSMFVGNYKAPPSLATAVNNYLSTGKDTSPLSTLANVNSRIKNVIMSSGVPGTATSWHGITELVRHSLASDNPVQGFLEAGKYMLRPKLAQGYIDRSLSLAGEAVKSGVQLGIEDHSFFDKQAENLGVLGKVNEWHKGLFEHGLFQQMIPALKISAWDGLKAKLIESGLSEYEAGRAAATQVNHLYGGENLAQLGRNPQFQLLARSVAFAPDFYEGTSGIGKGMIQGLIHPGTAEYSMYRTFARNLIGSYVGLNMLNKMTSGHFAVENEEGHKFELEVGYTADGGKRYITPYGSAIDMIKLPLDFISGLVAGKSDTPLKIIRNRLAPLPAQGFQQMTGINYMGQRMYPQNSTLPEQLQGRATEALASNLPPQLGAAVRYAGGEMGGEEAIASGLQAPFRYGGTASNKTDKEMLSIMQAGGATPEQIYSKINEQPNQPTTFSQPQSDGSVSSLLSAINTTKQKNQETAFIKKAYDSGMSQQQIDTALQQYGIDPQAAQYTMLRGLEVEPRAEVTKQLLIDAGQDWNSKFQELVQNKVLTTAVVAQWLDSGLIDEQGQKVWNQGIKDVKNAGKPTASTRAAATPRMPAISQTHASMPHTPTSSTQGYQLRPMSHYLIQTPEQIQAQLQKNQPTGKPSPYPSMQKPLQYQNTIGM